MNVVKRNLIYTTLLGSTVAMLAPVHAAEGWLTDLPSAMRKAEVEKKLILIDFTGSDWCSACINLRRNVLDNPDFRAYANAHFILMEVDLPRRKSFDPALRARNEAIAARYSVAAYPTIMVLSPQGRVLGGFQEGDKTVKEAIASLDNACMVDALFRKAAMQSGVARAKTLYEAYLLYPDSKGFAVFNESLRNEIMECDPENVTGIHDAAAVIEQARLFLNQRERLAFNSPELGKLLEHQLSVALPVNRPSVMLARCQYAMTTAETVEDIAATRRMFEELIPLLPEGQAAEIRHYTDTYFRDPAELLRMLKASRPR